MLLAAEWEQIVEMRADIKQAVEAEDYEQAAVFKKDLNALLTSTQCLSALDGTKKLKSYDR